MVIKVFIFIVVMLTLLYHHAHKLVLVTIIDWHYDLELRILVTKRKNDKIQRNATQ